MREVLFWSLMSLAAVGCSLEKGAKEKFSRELSCPMSDVEVRPRTDLNAYEMTFGTITPPADVAADPRRLAIWQKEEDEKRASWNRSVNLFEARGCGYHVLYDCCRANGRSCRSSSSSVVCIEKHLKGLPNW